MLSFHVLHFCFTCFLSKIKVCLDHDNTLAAILLIVKMKRPQWSKIYHCLLHPLHPGLGASSIPSFAGHSSLPSSLFLAQPSFLCLFQYTMNIPPMWSLLQHHLFILLPSNNFNYVSKYSHLCSWLWQSHVIYKALPIVPVNFVPSGDFPWYVSPLQWYIIK